MGFMRVLLVVSVLLAIASCSLNSTKPADVTSIIDVDKISPSIDAASTVPNNHSVNNLPASLSEINFRDFDSDDGAVEKSAEERLKIEDGSNQGSVEEEPPKSEPFDVNADENGNGQPEKPKEEDSDDFLSERRLNPQKIKTADNKSSSNSQVKFQKSTVGNKNKAYKVEGRAKTTRQIQPRTKKPKKVEGDDETLFKEDSRKQKRHLYVNDNIRKEFTDIPYSFYTTDPRLMSSNINRIRQVDQNVDGDWIVNPYQDSVQRISNMKDIRQVNRYPNDYWVGDQIGDWPIYSKIKQNNPDLVDDSWLLDSKIRQDNPDIIYDSWLTYNRQRNPNVVDYSWPIESILKNIKYNKPSSDRDRWQITRDSKDSMQMIPCFYNGNWLLYPQDKDLWNNNPCHLDLEWRPYPNYGYQTTYDRAGVW